MVDEEPKTTTITVKCGVPYALRQLANALDRRDAMRRQPGIHAHTVRFFYGEDELKGSENNETLRREVAEEIRAQWDTLKQAAFDRTDREIEVWRTDLVAALQAMAPGRRRDGCLSARPL